MACFQGALKYVSPRSMTEMRLPSLEIQDRRMSMMYREFAVFRQEWKVHAECPSQRGGGTRSGRVWNGFRLTVGREGRVSLFGLRLSSPSPKPHARWCSCCHVHARPP